jgi:transcription elongation factor Elf1
MDYCPGHPGHDEDYRGNCKFCGHPRKSSQKAPQLGDYVDPFALARGLQAREEQKSREWIPRINNCPYCQIKALSYNLVINTFECLNIKCAKYHVQIQSMSVEYSFVITYVKTQKQ